MICRRCHATLSKEDVRIQRNVTSKHCKKCRMKMLDDCNLPEVKP